MAASTMRLFRDINQITESSLPIDIELVEGYAMIINGVRRIALCRGRIYGKRTQFDIVIYNVTSFCRSSDDS
jgi:hypothetical protein